MGKHRVELSTEEMLQQMEKLRRQVEAQAKALGRPVPEMPVAKVPKKATRRPPRRAAEPLTPPPPEPKARVSPEQEEELLALARASLRAYGTLVPPVEATYSVRRATCPNCDHEGPLAEDFGFKTGWKGKVKPQSWCRWCRAAISAESHRRRRAKQGR